MPDQTSSRRGALRAVFHAPAAPGIVLLAATAVALIAANSPAARAYETILRFGIGPLPLDHWINDGLMTVFFLLVGLEIKREAIEGQLSTWRRRAMPGMAAAGGMIVPALVYLALAGGEAPGGWAIPAATDIAFALGVVALLGDRVPRSLRVFLAALAIVDDLGAVAIIAFFYTGHVAVPDLAGAIGMIGVLVALNRFRVRRLTPYLLVGALLWVLVLRSGVHATLAGVMLAMTIPIERAGADRADRGISPLHRLERALHLPVGFVVVPLFALANAGVPLRGLPAGAMAAPVTLGVAGGLLIGKVAGVLGASTLAIRLGLAEAPAGATRRQMLGIALLCGIGFTMSIFITLLAFPADPVLQVEAKLGVLGGSLLSGMLGYAVLRGAEGMHPARS